MTETNDAAVELELRAYAPKIHLETTAAAAGPISRLVLKAADTIAAGAGDRATALRWIHEAEGTNGDDGYLEYTVGIRYGYIKETV